MVKDFDDVDVDDFDDYQAFSDDDVFDEDDDYQDYDDFEYFIPCILWKGIAENTVEYVKKGDLIGVKGHLQNRNIEIDENTKRQAVEVIAEKVTFLSSNKKEAD